MPDETVNPEKTRRALVMEGGGAKGAYAFGALLAFREAGLRFDAVAGTSAGALNGLLWSTDSLQRGQEIWERLSFGSTYPVRILSAKSYPGWFIRLTGSMYVLLHLVLATIAGIPNDLDLFIRIAIGVCAATCVVPLLLGGGHRLLILAAGALFALWFARAMRDDEGRRQWRSMTELYVRFFPVAVVVIALLHLRIWDEGVSKTLKISLLVGAGLFVFIFVNWIIYRAGRLLEKITVLGREGLANEVKTILVTKPIGIPTWVTTAVYAELYDPDRASTFTNFGYGTKVKVFDTLRGTWIPHYSELSKRSKKEAMQLCLASAALPFGIVPPVMVNDVKHVDGGVVDNCPLFPFIDNPDIDEIFVVSLKGGDKAKASFSRSECIERWKQLRRTLDVFHYSGPREVLFSSNDPPTKLSYQEPQNVPRIVSFHPGKNLGGLFGGTLNFTADYAQLLICRGRLQTLSQLRTLELHQSAIA